MATFRRGSIRLWQTELFVAVIVVAILILSGLLSAALTANLSRMAETSELHNATALAQRLEAEFPLSGRDTTALRAVVSEYRDIYGGGIWIYDNQGNLVEWANDEAPLHSVLDRARRGGTGYDWSYSASDLKENGWVVASKPLYGRDGSSQGVVVTMGGAEQAVEVLRSVRSRMWATFWISLAVAGLMGFAFSEVISTRMRAMSGAAAAIAAGDFEQRLTPGLVPDEVRDLAESYNTMAATLGETFAELEESRRQIAVVVESMAEGVLGLDSSGVVNVANPEAAKLLGVPRDELPGMSVDEITDQPELLAAVRDGLSGERTSRTITLGECVVAVRCAPLASTDGTVEGTVLLLADITERHRTEEAQRRFVADASHEMRTPISALKGVLELLAEGAKNDPATLDDFIHTMQVEVDRLGRLVADLLTLARLEAGSLELRLSPQYAGDILGNVTGVMQTLAEQAGVRLSVEVPDEELRVHADRDRIVQVLVSFTDNAIKHSPDGGMVVLRADRDGDAVRFEVSDEGAGVEEAEIPRLFERFYRADTARAGGGGVGLGLAIAKEIVEAHGSTIAVRSAPGAGTTFSFNLPFG